MVNFNKAASQILNGASNFLSANANAARDLIVNPAVDLGSYAAKGYARGGAMLLGKDPDKAAAAVDKVADVLKTGGGYNAKQEVDPTSTAGAVGDGLIRGVDQAAAVLTLAEAAKQLPKAAQKGWKAILNKVNKADTPAKQKAVAKEARDYVTKHIEINDDLSKRMYNQSAEVPAYQQRAYAAENPGMSKYKTKAAEVNFATTKGGDTSTPLWPMTSYENSLKQKLTPERASQLGVPYRKWTYGDHLKASNQRFLDEAPTPRSKAIRTNESKWANDLGMTAEQLRDEANKYGGSTQWYYEQRKALDKLGVNNFNDYAKTMGLDGGTPNIYDVKEYNRIKNSGAKVVRDPSNNIVDSSTYNPRNPNIDIDRLDILARKAGYKDYEDAYTKWANNDYGFVSPEEMIKEAITLDAEAAADAASQVASARAESWPLTL